MRCLHAGKKVGVTHTISEKCKQLIESERVELTHSVDGGNVDIDNQITSYPKQKILGTQIDVIWEPVGLPHQLQIADITGSLKLINKS